MQAVSQEAQGRLKIGRPVAIIDIGSNSVRLVAYEGLSRAVTPIYNEKVLCGLGRHVATTGRLDDEAVDRALRALARFRVLCDTMQVSEVFVLATAAARDASNGPAFLEAAAKACGQPISLLSGAEEARASALGVIAGFYEPDGMVGDMGGGSLELVDVQGSQVGQGITMPLGGLALQDVSGGSLRKAQRIVREALERAPEYLENLHGRTFYAVGGTWRALARLHQAARDYPLHVMHGYMIDPDDGLDFLHLVEEADSKTLKDIESVSEARRPLLAYGAIVLEEIIRLGEPKQVAISAFGVREGILFDRLDPQTRERDPLLAAASDLNLLRSRSPRHGVELCQWTEAFIRSINLIAYGAFAGLDHPGRAYLALSIFFRHEGLSPDKVGSRIKTLAGPRLIERARLLAALMRIAYPVSVAMEGVLPHAPLMPRGNQVVLRLPSHMGPLANERLNGRLRALGKLLNMEPVVEIG
jgi:exopolyphosphatase / guanosine-5'-triphosphate,3'-diphosphate pyrophosphatase